MPGTVLISTLYPDLFFLRRRACEWLSERNSGG